MFGGHYDLFGLRVNLGVELSISNQIDNPRLSLIKRQIKLRSKHSVHQNHYEWSKINSLLKVDALVNSTVGFEYAEAGAFNEFILKSLEKEVTAQHNLALLQLLLSALKVEINKQALNELDKKWHQCRI